MVWKGPILKPHFIDTSLLGNVRIQITLVTGNVNSSGEPAGDPSTSANADRNYTLKNNYLSVDTISLSDGIYGSMVDQRLASGTPIDVPFKKYFSYTKSEPNMQIHLPFSVASQSIDRLWAITRDSMYGDANQHTVPLESAELTSQKKVYPYFNYNATGSNGFQFQINNTTYPNWKSKNPRDWYGLLKLAMGDNGNMLSSSYPVSAQSYRDNFFVFAVYLEHHQDGDYRFISGIDTRGSSANCIFASDNDSAVADKTRQAVVFAECTSLLRIHANKVVEIVQ